MRHEPYTNLRAAEDFQVFEFESVGWHGTIRKRIAFMPTKMAGVYNLVFGDIGENGTLDIYATSDNGNRNRVLATVTKAVEIYTSRYPERWIYFSGSTRERTRLYRMAININLQELSEKFEIYAEVSGRNEFQAFNKNMPVEAFLIRRKKILYLCS